MLNFLRRRRSDTPASADPVADQTTDAATESGTVAVLQADDRGADLDDLETRAASPARQDAGARSTLRAVAALARATHPRFVIGTAAGLALVAILAGRPAREVLVVLATVVVGQSLLGWHNDLVDRERDRELAIAGKPLAEGRLEPGTVWFAVACAALLLVPLGVTNGLTAGSAYLLSILIGVLGNVVLRQGALSWVTWALSYALLPAFVTYGGFGGQAEGDPPRVIVTVLAALLGVGVHVLTSLWGLVPDDAAGWRTLPLRLGRRLGSTGLLRVVAIYLALVGVALVVVSATGGLSRP